MEENIHGPGPCPRQRDVGGPLCLLGVLAACGAYGGADSRSPQHFSISSEQGMSVEGFGWEEG